MKKIYEFNTINKYIIYSNGIKGADANWSDIINLYSNPFTTEVP